jgi:mevalonate kinase
VLSGGSALMLTSPPHFVMEFKDGSTPCPFHPSCTAGKLYATKADFFDRTQICFHDPHHGCGGFGASGAEFLGLALALKPQATPWELHELYRQYASNSSGADILVQAFARDEAPSFVHVSMKEKKLEKWTLPETGEYRISVFHTGVKLNTHEHLQKNPRVPDALQAIVQNGMEAWRKKDLSAFIESIHAYGKELDSAGFLAPHSAELVAALYKEQNAAAAKGCGAMGADVLLAITKTSIPETWYKEKKLSKVFESWI